MLALAGQVASVGHLVLVRHTMCLEHGELVDSVASPRADVVGRRSASAAVRPAGRQSPCAARACGDRAPGRAVLAAAACVAVCARAGVAATDLSPGAQGLSTRVAGPASVCALRECRSAVVQGDA
jgi:hypothetical protein